MHTSNLEIDQRVNHIQPGKSLVLTHLNISVSFTTKMTEQLSYWNTLCSFKTVVVLVNMWESARCAHLVKVLTTFFSLHTDTLPLGSWIMRDPHPTEKQCTLTKQEANKQHFLKMFNF